MGRIVYTENVGFDLSDWESKRLIRVAAGSNCIMALTAEGKVLTKSREIGKDEETEPGFLKKIARFFLRDGSEQWTGLKEIAVSGSAGVAVGLMKNGNCVMKRLESCSAKLNAEIYRKAQIAVDSWRNIVAIAVSDAVFALDSFGRVYHAPLTLGGSYRETAEWRNIVRLVIGGDGVVFGITSDGHVAVCGVNFSKTLKRALESLRDAVDLGVAGTERKQVVVVHRDGTAEDLRTGARYDFLCIPESGCIQSHRGGMAVRDSAGVLHFIACTETMLSPVPFGSAAVSSFALGDVDHGPSFVIALEA